MSRVVSSVEYQKRRQDRVNVFLDGEFAFAIPAKVALDFGLRPGLVLSDAETERCQVAGESQEAYDAAANLISHRPRSERELRQRLLQRKFLEAAVDSALEKLKDLKLVDDAAFARYWVENRDSFSPRGTFALRSELRGKGVSSEDIEEATSGEREESGQALALARKRVRSLPKTDHRAFRQKLEPFLARRGFNRDAINEAARQLWSEIGGEEGD